MSTELKHLLYHGICNEFEESLSKIEAGVSRYGKLLLKIQKLGAWSAAIVVEGEDTKDQTINDLVLLEKSGILESKMKFTHRNIYRVFALTERGKNLVKKLESDRK
jgi:hypothetical protein